MSAENEALLCDPCPVKRDPENLRFQAVSKRLIKEEVIVASSG